MTNGFAKINVVGSHKRTSLPLYMCRTACSCSGFCTVPSFPASETANNSALKLVREKPSLSINYIKRTYTIRCKPSVLSSPEVYPPVKVRWGGGGWG